MKIAKLIRKLQELEEVHGPKVRIRVKSFGTCGNEYLGNSAKESLTYDRVNHTVTLLSANYLLYLERG